MNCLCALTIVNPKLPLLMQIAKDVAPTVELVKSVTSDCVYWFNFVI